MAKGLVALEAQISALAQADAEKRVAKVMKAARVIAKALAKVAKQMSSFQKAAGGKARLGRKPGRKPGRRPGHKPGRKSAGKRGRKAGITPAALKSLRKKLGVNQDGLAKLLKVSLSSIRTWEQGRAKPRKAKLAQILALQAKR
jgi:DNA-binding XRE family transcriptional regulator